MPWLGTIQSHGATLSFIILREYSFSDMVVSMKRSNSGVSEDIFRAESLSCPFAAWKKVRDNDPVPWVTPPGSDEGAYLITRRSDIEFVGRHPELFKSEVDARVWRWGNDLHPELAAIIEEDGGYQIVHTIVTSDPPMAHRYRRIALEALSPPKIRAKVDEIQSLVDELIEQVPDNEAFDFRDVFSVPLPLRVIMSAYGLPREDEPFVYDFTCAVINFVDPITPLEQAKKDLRLIIRAQKYLAALIKEYRQKPGDNFVSAIANARDEEGNLLSVEETISLALVTVIGGNETTRNALTTAAYVLARDKDLWQALKNDRDKVPAFIEELVRYGCPAIMTPRQAVEDTVLDGTPIHKGASVYVMWGAGSHDDSVFESPLEVRLERPNIRQHTSFGSGVHHCAGVHLARKEMELSIQSWLENFKSMELAVPESEIVYAPTFTIRQLFSLPLKVTKY